MISRGKYFIAREPCGPSLSPTYTRRYRKHFSDLEFRALTPEVPRQQSNPIPKVIIFDRERALKLLDEFEMEEMQYSSPVRARLSLRQLNPNLLAQNTPEQSLTRKTARDRVAVSQSRHITRELTQKSEFLEDKSFTRHSHAHVSRELEQFSLSGRRESGSFSNASEPELDVPGTHNDAWSLGVSGPAKSSCIASEAQVPRRVQVSNIRKQARTSDETKVFAMESESSVLVDSFASEVEIIPRKLGGAVPPQLNSNTFLSDKTMSAMRDNSDEDLFAHPVSESVAYLSEDESEFELEQSIHNSVPKSEVSYQSEEPARSENSLAILDGICKAPIPVHFSRNDDQVPAEPSVSTTYTEDLLATMEFEEDPDPEESLIIAFAELHAAHPELNLTYTTLMSFADFLLEECITTVISDV